LEKVRGSMPNLISLMIARQDEKGDISCVEIRKEGQYLLNEKRQRR
jgi:hypothetical protein